MSLRLHVDTQVHFHLKCQVKVLEYSMHHFRKIFEWVPNTALLVLTFVMKTQSINQQLNSQLHCRAVVIRNDANADNQKNFRCMFLLWQHPACIITRVCVCLVHVTDMCGITAQNGK